MLFADICELIHWTKRLQLCSVLFFIQLIILWNPFSHHCPGDTFLSLLSLCPYSKIFSVTLDYVPVRFLWGVKHCEKNFVLLYIYTQFFFISRRFFFLQKIGQKTYVLVCFLLQGSEQFRMGFSVRSLYLVFISCYKLQMYALNISLNEMMNGVCRIWPWLRRKTSKV